MTNAKSRQNQDDYFDFGGENMGNGNFLHKLFEDLLAVISSVEFKVRACLSKSNFSRNRKLGFSQYMMFILGNKRRSLQLELNDFLKETYAPFNTYSKQAFSKQRQFIRPEAFQELLYLAAEMFYKLTKYDTFHGYVLAAIDGTKLNLQNFKNLKEIYGTQDSNGAPQVQALSSALYDVLNGIILDVSLNPCRSNERNLAMEHFKVLNRYAFSKVLVLMDRGYPSAEIINAMEQNHLSYVMRCPASFIAKMKLDSSDCIITHKFQNDSQPYKMRILRFTVNGSTEILATNIMDENFRIQDFKELYHMRWEIETAYDHLKNHVELENFSGNTDVAVRQDFYAAYFLFTIAQIEVFASREAFDKKHNSKGNKYLYKQNLAQTIGRVKASLVELLSCRSNSKRRRCLNAIMEALLHCTTPIRPGRSCPRQAKRFSKKYYNCKKRVL